MKFYFSSFEIGDEPEKLKRLFTDNVQAVYIANAMDRYGDNERTRERKEKDMQSLRDLGLYVELLDLREYFGKREALSKKISSVGVIWVSGGNTFDLRIAMHLSGFDEILKGLGDRNIIYGGYSAGVCVLSQHLKGYDGTDSPSANPYGQETIWDGVGLIDWMFVPHFESDHEESEAATNEVAYYKKYGLAFKTLRDGEVIVMNDF